VYKELLRLTSKGDKEFKIASSLNNKSLDYKYAYNKHNDRLVKKVQKPHKIEGANSVWECSRYCHCLLTISCMC
jgi:hypothetical protein